MDADPEGLSRLDLAGRVMTEPQRYSDADWQRVERLLASHARRAVALEQAAIAIEVRRAYRAG
jgi:hypothetical protein